VGVGIYDHRRGLANAIRSMARLVARSRREALHVAQQAGQFVARQWTVATRTCERLASH
jgi:hypothetical protein